MATQIEIGKIEIEVRNLPTLIQSFGPKIETEETLKRVNETKLGIRQLRNKIKAHFEPLRNLAYAPYKAILDKWKETEAPVQEAEKACDNLLSCYFAEQRRIREEAERKRLEEIRKQKEEEDRKLREALEAESKGDIEKAEQLINEVAIQEQETKPTVTIPEKPKLNNVHSRVDYDFEIVDEQAIPRDYLIPNETLIRKMVKASQGKINIPGIKVIAKDTIVTRQR